MAARGLVQANTLGVFHCQTLLASAINLPLALRGQN